MDRFVTLRGDADALPASEEVDDEARARPRLARAGRPLDEEVRPLDSLDEFLRLLDGLDLDAVATERRLAPENPLKVRVASVIGEEGGAEPQQRRLLGLCLQRAAGD